MLQYFKISDKKLISSSLSGSSGQILTRIVQNCYSLNFLCIQKIYWCYTKCLIVNFFKIYKFTIYISTRLINNLRKKESIKNKKIYKTLIVWFLINRKMKKNISKIENLSKIFQRQIKKIYEMFLLFLKLFKLKHEIWTSQNTD